MSDTVKLTERIPTLVLAAASLVFLAAVWLSRPSGSAEFPKAVQDGLGLLLAALVFVLGFARESQQRVSAAALETFRQHHETLLEAWMSREDLGLRSCDLIDLAMRRVSDATAFRQMAATTQSKETRRLVALVVKREAIWAEFNQLSYLFAYQQRMAKESELQAEMQAKNREYEIPEFFRANSEAHLKQVRRRLPTIENDLAEVGAKQSALDAAGGAGTAELATGLSRIRLATTTHALMQNAHRFVTGMALLYVAGILYAGPSPEVLGSPELWVATLVVVVALTYVGLVARDVRNDLYFTSKAVDQLPLGVLAEMEIGFSRPDSLSPDEAIARGVEFWRKHAWWLLRLAEVQAPGLTWINSVRGRYELVLALNSGTFSSRQRKEREWHLRRAEEHLRIATDDPAALIALARVREELGDSSASAALVRAAAELLRRLPAPWRPGDGGWDRTLDIPNLLRGQWWLWPKDVEAVAVLKRELDVDDDEG